MDRYIEASELLPSLLGIVQKEDGMYAIIEDEAGSLFYKEVIVDLSATVEKSGLLVLETIYINEKNKYFDLKESDYIKDIKNNMEI